MFTDITKTLNIINNSKIKNLQQITHELRNPNNQIGLLAEATQYETELPKIYGNYLNLFLLKILKIDNLQLIQATVVINQNTINDMLDIGQMKQGI